MFWLPWTALCGRCCILRFQLTQLGWEAPTTGLRLIFRSEQELIRALVVLKRIDEVESCPDGVLLNEEFKRPERVRQRSPKVSVHRNHVIPVLDKRGTEPSGELLNCSQLTPLHQLDNAVRSRPLRLSQHDESRDECRATRTNYGFFQPITAGQIEFNNFRIHVCTTENYKNYLVRTSLA